MSDADNSEEPPHLNLEVENFDADVIIHKLVHHAGYSEEEVVRILDWEIDPKSSDTGVDLLFPEEIVSAMEHIPDAVCYITFTI
jgi:hypothetical protein